MKRLLLGIGALLLVLSGSARAFVALGSGRGGGGGGTGSGTITYFNCGAGFTVGGNCGVGGVVGTGVAFRVVGGAGSPSLPFPQVLLMSASSNHAAEVLNYILTLVPVSTFTTVFTFVPNGQNLALVFNNTNNQPGYEGPAFIAGAGCEAAFYQGCCNGNPNNVFALEFDQYNPLLDGSGQTFSYSSVQYYTSSNSNTPLGVQCPCMSSVEVCPGQPQPSPTITKLSTSPVALNSPSGTAYSTSTHTFNAKVVYDGSNLTLNLFDVTAGGACPGVNCYTKTWTGVNIPTSVAASTAYVGLSSATASANFPTTNLYINSWTYTSP